MDIVTKDEFHVNFDEFKNGIEEGAIFIHPTDTIYGLGCDATNKECVKKIRDIKDRHESPFSIIVPSKEWILSNCHVTESGRKWVDKLPGPYTLILKLKNKQCIAGNVNFNLDTIGVRIPNHWISDIVKKLGTPIVTTSANRSGDNFMTSLDSLNKAIEQSTDFILYEEEKHGKPSVIVDLTGDEPVMTRR